jgi:uncharacterized membrane protein
MFEKDKPLFVRVFICSTWAIFSVITLISLKLDLDLWIMPETIDCYVIRIGEFFIAVMIIELIYCTIGFIKRKKSREGQKGVRS